MIGYNCSYSEVHHIRPLGNPYICVYPNYPRMLDYGFVPININEIISISLHTIDLHHITYYNQWV